MTRANEYMSFCVVGALSAGLSAFSNSGAVHLMAPVRTFDPIVQSLKQSRRTVARPRSVKYATCSPSLISTRTLDCNSPSERFHVKKMN
jgi:hypothetical protein